MSFYRVPLYCPKCQKGLVAFDVAVGPEWGLALNVRCECGFEGGVELDMCDLVARAREECGMVLQ